MYFNSRFKTMFTRAKPHIKLINQLNTVVVVTEDIKHFGKIKQ
jgi:hypothetical protein